MRADTSQRRGLSARGAADNCKKKYNLKNVKMVVLILEFWSMTFEITRQLLLPYFILDTTNDAQRETTSWSFLKTISAIKVLSQFALGQGVF